MTVSLGVCQWYGATQPGANRASSTLAPWEGLPRTAEMVKQSGAFGAGPNFVAAARATTGLSSWPRRVGTEHKRKAQITPMALRKYLSGMEASWRGWKGRPRIWRHFTRSGSQNLQRVSWAWISGALALLVHPGCAASQNPAV